MKKLYCDITAYGIELSYNIPLKGMKDEDKVEYSTHEKNFKDSFTFCKKHVSFYTNMVLFYYPNHKMKRKGIQIGKFV